MGSDCLFDQGLDWLISEEKIVIVFTQQDLCQHDPQTFFGKPTFVECKLVIIRNPCIKNMQNVMLTCNSYIYI